MVIAVILPANQLKLSPAPFKGQLQDNFEGFMTLTDWCRESDSLPERRDWSWCQPSLLRSLRDISSLPGQTGPSSGRSPPLPGQHSRGQTLENFPHWLWVLQPDGDGGQVLNEKLLDHFLLPGFAPGCQQQKYCQLETFVKHYQPFAMTNISQVCQL